MSLLDRYSDDSTPLETLQNKLDTEQDLVAELLYNCDVFGNEAFSVGDVTRYLSNKAGAFVDSIRGAFGKLMSVNNKPMPSRLNARDVKSQITGLRYTDLIDVTIHVPVGFKGNLLQYAQLFHTEVEQYSSKLISDVLLPAQQRFGYYINNPGDLNTRRNFEAGAQFTAEQLSALKLKDREFHIDGNHSARMPYGTVVNNNNEYVEALALVNDAVKDHWNFCAPKQVMAEVDKLVQISTTLLGILQQGTSTEPSREFVKVIASEVRLVAEWVEWYSYFTTRLSDFSAAMKTNESVFENL